MYKGWYVSHGQDSRARQILTKYHGNGNTDSAIVDLQMREMKEVIETERGTDKRYADIIFTYVAYATQFFRWWDFRGLLRTRSDRHRFFLVACIAFFGQWDLPPTSYYFPLL